MALGMKRTAILALVFLLGACVGFGCHRFFVLAGEPSNRFAGANSVQIYDLNGFDYSKYTTAEFDQVARCQFNQLVFRNSASSAKWSNGIHFWKGSLLATIKYDAGPDEIVIVSYYGGFFSVVGKPGIWIVDAEHRVAWDTELKQIIEGTFFPARKRGNRLSP